MVWLEQVQLLVSLRSLFTNSSGKIISLTQQGSQTAINRTTKIPPTIIMEMSAVEFIRICADDAQGNGDGVLPGVCGRGLGYIFDFLVGFGG